MAGSEAGGTRPEPRSSPPEDRLAELWAKAYQGARRAAVGGSPSSWGMPTRLPKCGCSPPWSSGQRRQVAPALERAGVSMQPDPEIVATAEGAAVRRAGADLSRDLMSTFGPITAQYIPLYQRIGELSPAERDTADLLVAHEKALCDFARAEIDGDRGPGRWSRSRRSPTWAEPRRTPAAAHPDDQAAAQLREQQGQQVALPVTPGRAAGRAPRLEPWYLAPLPWWPRKWPGSSSLSCCGSRLPAASQPLPGSISSRPGRGGRGRGCQRGREDQPPAGMCRILLPVTSAQATVLGVDLTTDPLVGASLRRAPGACRASLRRAQCGGKCPVRRRRASACRWKRALTGPSSGSD